MTNSDEPRFYVDESLMGLARALPVLRRDVTAVDHPRGGHGIELGTLDPDWLPIVGARGWVVIGRDSRVRTRPGERELVVKHAVRWIRLGAKRDLSNWQYMELLITKWDQIENYIVANPVGPWFIRVTPAGGIKPMSLD